MASPDPTAAFLAEMAEYGLAPGTIEWSGKVVRFPGAGKGRGNTAAWYLAWPDRLGGCYGDYSAGLDTVNWQLRNGQRPDDFDSAAWAAMKQEMREREEAREAQRLERQRAAAEEARERWERAAPADPRHSYLVAKKVGPNGIHQEGARLVVAMKACEEGNPLCNLQFIDPLGEKRFIAGARVSGTRATLGSAAFERDNLLYIAEGFSTGATIHEVTQSAVVIAWNMGNLRAVAEYHRKRYPDARIIIAADNDRWTRHHTGAPNSGLLAAREVAEACGCEVAVPDFKAEHLRPVGDEKGPTDFNDLYVLDGADAVRYWLDPANAPQAVTEAADGPPPLPTQPPAVDPTPHRAEPERPDPAPGANEELVLNPNDPYPGAQEFQRRHYEVDGTRTLHEQQGVFYGYDGAAYRVIEALAIRSELWDFANRAQMWKKKGDDFELVPFQPTTSKVSNLFDATRAVTLLKAEHGPPCWLEERPGDPPAGLLVAFQNGVLDVRDRTLYPTTPRFFTTNALPFPCVPNPPQPTRWIQFLHELWGDDEGHVDEQSIEALQEMFGYFLLPDTRQQKIFLLVGPKRSGKGTIGRVLTALLGQANVCGPTLSSLSQNFGLWPLIGKQLAIISDARLGSRSDQASIAERLLSISGEDHLTIDRKHISPWTGQLATRFMILTNELPSLQDTSGALASRFIVLVLNRSFYGAEDTELTPALFQELPGIFRWALDGLDRLGERGRFVQPELAQDAVRELEDLGSPVAAFIRDRCVVEPGERVVTDELYQAWRDYCKDQGRDHPGTKNTFGRNLGAAVPGLRRSRPRWGGDRVWLYEGIGLSGEAAS